MCVPACTIQLARAVSRRSLLRSVGAAACAAAATVPPSAAADEATPTQRLSFSHVVDLTHTLGPDFPMPVANGFELERVSTRPKDRWNIYRWHLHEHIGTHLDAPLHCSTLDSGDRIPVERLVGPLAVVGGGEPGEPRASAAKRDDDHRGQPQDRGLHGRAQPRHRAFLRSRILQDGF